MAEFVNDPEDVKWLKETYLKGMPYPPFKSFIIDETNGWVELYESADPLYTDRPITKIWFDYSR